MARLKRSQQGKSQALRIAPLTYEQQRLYWRSSLSDDIVRALAADYLRGYEDECNLDAFREYERRFGTHGATSEGRYKRSKKARARR